MNCFGQQLSVQELVSDTLKSQFLEQIFISDQEVRKRWESTNRNDTLAYKAIVREVLETDSSNYLKIREYLLQYNYPSKDSFSTTVSMTPWLVVHHSPYRSHHFEIYPFIQQAFVKESISEEQYRMYAARSLSMFYKKQFRIFYRKKIPVLQKKMMKGYFNEKKRLSENR
jgi:hypothetical protein